MVDIRIRISIFDNAGQRVFDSADVLSDKEEKKLEELIARREKQTGCDIVLVTLCESLEEYAREIEPDVPYNQFVRIYKCYDSGQYRKPSRHIHI